MIKRVLRRFAAKPAPVAPESPWTKKDLAYARYNVGDWTYGRPRVLWHEHGRTLTIGRFCSIGPNVTIMIGGNHQTAWVTTFPFAELMPGFEASPKQGCTKGDVVIGNDVWIGQDSLILSGITIHNGAIVAARSVVTRDVPPYAIVAGNPARIVRLRVPEHLIADLLGIAWWDWPLEKIQSAVPHLLSENIETFVRLYSPRAGEVTTSLR